MSIHVGDAGTSKGQAKGGGLSGMRKVSKNKEKHLLRKNDLEEFGKGLNNTVQALIQLLLPAKSSLMIIENTAQQSALWQRQVTVSYS